MDSQNTCCRCGKSINVFNKGMNIYNAKICNACLKYGMISNFDNSMAFDEHSITAFIDARTEMANQYRMTMKIESQIEIDEPNRIFKICGELFSFENLMSFAFREDRSLVPHQIAGAAIGGATGTAVGTLTNVDSKAIIGSKKKVAAGGVLGGSLGALTGALVGSLVKTDMCHSMEIEVLLRNTFKNSILLKLISQDVDAHSEEYRRAKASSDKYLAALKAIDYINKNPEASGIDRFLPSAQSSGAQPLQGYIDGAVNSLKEPLKAISEAPGKFFTRIGNGLAGSEADCISRELQKYNAMREKGLITEEEYDEQKRRVI